MTYRILEPARDELRGAVDYYETAQSGLGEQFYDAFNIALDSVMENPLAWGEVMKDYRIRRLHRFPYGIVYRIEDAGILIVAVMHRHRHPDYWKERI